MKRRFIALVLASVVVISLTWVFSNTSHAASTVQAQITATQYRVQLDFGAETHRVGVFVFALDDQLKGNGTIDHFGPTDVTGSRLIVLKLPTEGQCFQADTYLDRHVAHQFIGGEQCPPTATTTTTTEPVTTTTTSSPTTTTSSRVPGSTSTTVTRFSTGTPSAPSGLPPTGSPLSELAGLGAVSALLGGWAVIDGRRRARL